MCILSHNGFLDALERGEACMVILGDAVHSERDGELDQMDDSMLMMDLIFRLKLRFPEHLFFIRGNHDSFAEEISKGGIPQGMFWRRSLKKARGKEYRKATTTCCPMSWPQTASAQPTRHHQEARSRPTCWSRSSAIPA